jgi:transposase
MRIVAGVDCHKSTHTVVFSDAVGNVIESVVIETTNAGYEKAIDIAKRLNCTEWGLEGSGCYGYAFAVYISATGSDVYDVPGILTKRDRKQSGKRAKSDYNDARAIASVVLREEGRLPKFYLAVSQRALRMRYDQRDRFVRERTKAANRLRGAALFIGITKLPTDLTPTKTAKQILRSADKLRQECTVNDATDAVLDELEEAAATIQSLNMRIAQIEKKIKPLTRRIAPQLLNIHGVSDVTAAGIIGHTGDIKNCRNASAFANRCGVAPVECSSGKRPAVRLNIGGDRQLNRLLHIAAMAQVRSKTHEGRTYYERKRTEGKTHLAAMRCLKRNLATVIYYRLKAVDQALMEFEPSNVTAASVFTKTVPRRTLRNTRNEMCIYSFRAQQIQSTPSLFNA